MSELQPRWRGHPGQVRLPTPAWLCVRLLMGPLSTPPFQIGCFQVPGHKGRPVAAAALPVSLLLVRHLQDGRGVREVGVMGEGSRWWASEVALAGGVADSPGTFLHPAAPNVPGGPAQSTEQRVLASVALHECRLCAQNLWACWGADPLQWAFNSEGCPPWGHPGGAPRASFLLMHRTWVLGGHGVLTSVPWGLLAQSECPEGL